MSRAAASDTTNERRFQDEDRAQLSARLRIVLVPLLVACAVVALVSFATSNGQGLWTAVAGLVVGAAVYGLDRRGLVERAVLLLLVGMLVAATLSMSVGAGIHDTGMILYPTIIVFGSLLMKPAAYRLLAALVVASVTLVWGLGISGRIAPEFRDMTDVADLLSLWTVLILQAVAVNLLARGLFRNLREARRENAERRAAEEEVRRLNAELERRVERRTAELAAANEDLESFSYSVSHDLRAPLRVASNYAGLLDQEFAGDWDPQAREFLERILASNSRMNVLIDELLRFARMGRREIAKQEVDMNAVLRGVVDLLAAGAPERDVEWVLHDLPPAFADPVLVEQVFSNLVGNALKYSGARERSRIEVGFDSAGGSPAYYVRDNGVGFDASQAERIFGLFERLHGDGDFEGSGIGLAIVHRIVAKHGGRVHAESEPGEGATFRFELPGE